MQHHKMIYYVLVILAVFSLETFGENGQAYFQRIPNANRDDPELVKAVDEALEAIRKEMPQVHEDALRVWKGFKGKAYVPNYTYRSWGIKIVLWIKNHKTIVFSSSEKVLKVFQVLNHKGLISEHAVLVLTQNVWSHLAYREGAPDWDKPEGQLPGREFGSETA